MKTLFTALFISALAINAYAEPAKTTTVIPAPPAPPAVTKPVAAPVAPKAATPAAKAEVKKPEAPKKEIDAEVFKKLNRENLVAFVKAAIAKDLKSFYRAHPQFAHNTSEAKFVKKFDPYTELPNDVAALEANDFANTTVKQGESNRYCGSRLIEASSEVKIQIVQDAHIYKTTQKYCPTGSEYKLVSFRIGYNEK